MFSRRKLLGGSGLLLAGGASRLSSAASAPRLARVHVAADRVIRTIAGLRPYRPSGFVVKAQKFDDKLVIHNYGHGGAGITLSWGTGLLAVEEAAQSEVRDCAVIGCGAVGLATARLLQERGYSPVIYAKQMPPSVTSSVAGGLWDPTTLCERSRITPEFRAQFGEASRLSFRRYQSLTGDLYGVRWLPLYTLAREASGVAAPTPDSPYSEVEPLYPEGRLLTPAEHPFDAPFARRKYSMLIEPAIYLNALIRDYQLAGGKIVVREFHSAREIATLRENLIFNCTGLGARSLFEDAELTPIKGQLVFLLPQPELDYMTIGPGDIYMFPRHDGVLLGGSFDKGLDNTVVDPAVTERILHDNAELFGGMRG